MIVKAKNVKVTVQVQEIELSNKDIKNQNEFKKKIFEETGYLIEKDLSLYKDICYIPGKSFVLPVRFNSTENEYKLYGFYKKLTLIEDKYFYEFINANVSKDDDGFVLLAESVHYSDKNKNAFSPKAN